LSGVLTGGGDDGEDDGVSWLAQIRVDDYDRERDEAENRGETNRMKNE